MYEYINYFCENRYCVSSSQIFLSFYFSHFFFFILCSYFFHFSSFPLPSIFHGSFLCAEESPALVSTGNINFPRRGRSPSALWTLVNNSSRFSDARMRFKSYTANTILVSSSRRFTIQLVELVCFEDCIKDCKFSLSRRIDCGLLAISLLRNLIFF